MELGWQTLHISVNQRSAQERDLQFWKSCYREEEVLLEAEEALVSCLLTFLWLLFLFFILKEIIILYIISFVYVCLCVCVSVCLCVCGCKSEVCQHLCMDCHQTSHTQ